MTALSVPPPAGGTRDPAPVQRQPLADALRGFALLGILVVNIASFASTYYGAAVADPLAASPIERGAFFARTFLFETKFYLLFSFLFGYSFALQMQSARREGRSFVPRMARRLGALWVLGLLHAVLLYPGDILTTYAVLGAVLLVLRRRSDRFLSAGAVALVLATSLLWAGFGYLLARLRIPMEVQGAYAEAAAALAAYRGTPATVIARHLHEMAQIWWVTGLVQAPIALAMFLAGLLAGRHGLLANTGPDRARLRRVLAWGLAVGLPGAAVYAWPSLRSEGVVREIPALAATLLTAPFLGAAYAAALLLWLGSARGRPWLALLAPAGRMALSNYLLQSAVCAWLFLAYGLRWIGTVGTLASMAIAFAIYAAQLLWSRWWMARFACGPVEWLLRAFTGLERPPMRRRA